MKKRMLSVLIAVLVLFCVMPSCFAEEKTQDGLNAVLMTEKAEYKKNEEIKATLTVTNTNDFAVSNVSLENGMIDGYEMVEGSQRTKVFESLQPGERVSLETTLKAPGSEAVKTGIENNPEKVLIAFGLLLLSIALLYYLVKNHKGKHVFSILLGFVIVGSGMMMMSDSPSAAEALSKIEVATKITVEQREVELKGVVSYCETEDTATLTIAEILPKDFPRTDNIMNPPAKAWKTEEGKSCYVSDTNICFFDNNTSKVVHDDLRMPVTESGNDYIFGSITFIMSGKKLERIEYNSDHTYFRNWNGVYVPPVHCIDVSPASLELKVGETKTFTLKSSSSGAVIRTVMSCPDCVSMTISPFVSVGDDPLEVSITGDTVGSGEIVIQPLDWRLGPESLHVTVTEANGGENADD